MDVARHEGFAALRVDLGHQKIDMVKLAITLDALERTPYDPHAVELCQVLEHELKGTAATKLASLKRSLAKRRVRDLDQHRYEILTDLSAIKALASMHNHKLAEREIVLNKFRVEFTPPSIVREAGNLQFHASVFVEGLFERGILCVVDGHYIDNLRIGNKSLGKLRARRRRIDEHLHFFEREIERRLEDFFAAGGTISHLTEIRIPTSSGSTPHAG